MSVVAGGICTSCITGSAHDGKPKGTIETIAKLQTYVAKPTLTPAKPGIIVIIPDVFGFPFINNRLIADEYAERSGRTVYLPDFMFDDAPDFALNDIINPIDGSSPGLLKKFEGWVTALCTFVPWSWRHRNSVSLPIIKNFFQILRTENPDLKIGAAGFCWGGRYAILAAQKTFNDPPLVDAVFAGHPSMLSIPADVSHPIRPISIAVASIDNWYPPKTAKKTEELWKPFEDIKTQFVIYEDAKHGFCVRGNMNNPKEKENMEKAIDQAVNWFNEYLA